METEIGFGGWIELSRVENMGWIIQVEEMSAVLRVYLLVFGPT